MPYDGTGVYNPPASPTFPAVGGTVIQADYYNAVIRDIAAALTNALKRDGQGPWTGPQNAGGKRAGTSRTRVTAIASGNTQGVSTDVFIRVLAATGHRAEVRVTKTAA